MGEKTVRLSVPADPSFARTVRMLAASLAATCDMSMDDVEDVRMAAEEGFVYCCATGPKTADAVFDLSQGQMRVSFTLGKGAIDDSDGALDLAELLLAAVCDEHGVSEDGERLVLLKRGMAYVG